MSLKNQGGFFPVPNGEVTTVNPDGATRVYEDLSSRNSLTDACYVNGGPHGGGYGAFNRDRDPGPWGDERGNADVTTATPRKKPDYGG